MFFRRERDEVYKALVAELSTANASTVTIGLTLLGAGLYLHMLLGAWDVLAFSFSGALFSLIKAVATGRQYRQVQSGSMSLRDAKRWEAIHFVLTSLVAASIGALMAAIFSISSFPAQLLAVAILFSYGAGVAVRLAVRPAIAIVAILMASVPAMVAASLQGNSLHYVLTIMFAGSMASGIQSAIQLYRVMLSQITQRLEMAARARTDSLTGLSNRHALSDLFARLQTSGSRFLAVHCFDLDRFKMVNDRLGHLAGDALLREIGVRLKSLIETPAIVARMGGDEFVVIHSLNRDLHEAGEMAKRIVEYLTRECVIERTKVTIGVSLGCTIAAAETADLTAAMRIADAASYRAKQRGGGIEMAVPVDVERALLAQAA